MIKTLLLHQTGKGTTDYQAKSLKLYYQRHLTDLDDTKTKLFFQMITRAASVGFDREKTTQRTHSLVQELEALPHHFPEQQELIPYQALWATIRFD